MTQVFGTIADDTLSGTYISGLEGNDRILVAYEDVNNRKLAFANGNQGNDLIILDYSLLARTFDENYGKQAISTLLGGQGNDSIIGGYGNDFIGGGKDDDSLRSGYGDDTVNGGQGNDLIKGDAGNDVLNGGLGNDIIIFGDDFFDDIIYGKEGQDTFLGINYDEVGGNPSQSTDIVMDFDPRNDKITIVDNDLLEKDSLTKIFLEHRIYESSEGLVIELQNNGLTLTLANISLSNIDINNFEFLSMSEFHI